MSTVAHSSSLSSGLALLLILLVVSTARGLVLYQDKCPDANNDELVMLWNWKNCSTFFKCAFSGVGKGMMPIELSCPLGLTFDPEIGVCGWWVESNPQPCHPIYYKTNPGVMH
ncbi:Hypothetical predicted protein [Cloeon dipterum]|uniref:Chitin-binding type-2 domain-containing protein n=1 Tax=Cloeon dipterum TaxID=197152 RepID=A0A8S1DRY5_9INSE|nr:Hypothetical predicted protein [Cloeon dipterum]